MDLTFSFGELYAVAQTNGYSDPYQFAKDLSRHNRVFIVYPNEIIGYEDGALITKEISVSCNIGT